MHLPTNITQLLGGEDRRPTSVVRIKVFDLPEKSRNIGFSSLRGALGAFRRLQVKQGEDDAGQIPLELSPKGSGNVADH
jgi:hypothetical protein